MPAPVASQPTSTSAPATATFPGSDNQSHIEFEAPASAELDLEQQLQLAQDRAKHGGKGRFSIDLSLELERQLNNMESPPITPLYNATTHATRNGKHETSGGGLDLNHGELAPDPEILAHIITQLRHSLTEMTKERDDLIKMLATANAQEASAKDALQHMTDKATDAEEELVAARKKIKEEGDQIVMLRAKVEESRRGLMRLQTEHRRQSMAPIDVSRASNLGLSPFGTPLSAKRQSFAPLTGSMQGRHGHGRISSVSDTGSGPLPTPDFISSPNSQTFGQVSPEACTSAPPTSGSRFSGLLGRLSPPDTEIPLPSTEPTPGSPSAPPDPAVMAELDMLKKELKSVKDQLDVVKHELIEVNEAKEASDICVKTLRDFIADNNVGATSGGASEAVKLPPLPSMTTGEEAESKRAPAPSTGSGWGFKLWGVDSPRLNVPQSASVAQSPALAPTSIVPSSATTIPAAPISRKLGGFFSSRSSVSSMSSQQPQLPHLQTNAASTGDSLYSLSDTSSSTGPISPGSDMQGLGTAHYTQREEDAIVVRDVTNLSYVQMHKLDVEIKKPRDVDGVPLSVSATDIDGLR